MKKITEQEYAELKFSANSKTHLILEQLRKLEVGEMIMIDKQEVTTKTPLTVLLANYFRSVPKFSTRTLQDKSGWVVKRIK